MFATVDFSSEETFIVYGSLAPGRPNHATIEHIKGLWEKGVVKGKLENEGWGAAMGYPGFRHAPPEVQETIEAFILFSKDLPANWPFLDEFEGSGYQRVLAEFVLEDGATGSGFIYALNS